MKRRLSLLVLAVLLVLLSSEIAGAQGLGTSYIIVHALNPEGVEIGSIEGMGLHFWPVYDGDSQIGYIAHNEETHNQPISISSGVHTIKVEFNGMILEQNVTLEPGETKQLVFIFNRVEINNNVLSFSLSDTAYGEKTMDGLTNIRADWTGTNFDDSFLGPSGKVASYGRYCTYYLNASGTVTSTPTSFVADISMELSADDSNSYVLQLLSCNLAVKKHLADATTNFDFWYSQNSTVADISNASHPAMGLYGIFMAYCVPNSWDREPLYSWAELRDQHYSMALLDASKNYGLTVMGDKCLLGWAGWVGNQHPPVSASQTMNWSLLGENWVMSSVPYDMLGTGIECGAIHPPVASFTYAPEKPMVGGNIIFDASDSQGEIVGYQWDWGDEQSESLTNPKTSHVFETPAVYTITLTVIDNDGLTDSFSEELDLTLKNGDLLLCRSYSSFIPNVDFWTHVGIYVEESNKVVEATGGSKVVTSPLAEWSWFGQNGRSETCVEAIRVKTNDSTRDKAVAFALDKVGQPYDLCSILLNKKQEGGDCWLCEKWYCSELVWAAYLSASGGQINLDQDELGLVSPDDIDSDDDVEMIGEHKEAIPQRVYWLILWGEAYSPVDLEIIDPDGFILDKQRSGIPGAMYEEVDRNEDGHLNDLFAIPEPKAGNYLIQIVPEPNALPTDTYSLEVTSNGQTTVLAKDVQIQDIPMPGYIFEVTIVGDFCGANFTDTDGYVDVWDLMQFADHWHTRTGEGNWDTKFDLTGPSFEDLDGYIDVWDLMAFADHWHEGQKP